MSIPMLPGADKYLASAQAKQEATQIRSYTDRIIDRANTEVSIFAVLADFFDLYPPSEANYKSWCPFSPEHPDGGMERGFRTYPNTNSSMCFMLHGYMSPVRMFAMKERIPNFKAAKRLLSFYGLGAPEHWRLRMNNMLVAQEQQATGIGNPQNAVEALSLSLAQHSDYSSRRFDTDVMEAMEVCLAVLDQCVSSGNPENVRNWLPRAKSKMLKVIEREN